MGWWPGGHSPLWARAGPWTRQCRRTFSAGFCSASSGHHCSRLLPPGRCPSLSNQGQEGVVGSHHCSHPHWLGSPIRSGLKTGVSHTPYSSHCTMLSGSQESEPFSDVYVTSCHPRAMSAGAREGTRQGPFPGARAAEASAAERSLQALAGAVVGGGFPHSTLRFSRSQTSIKTGPRDMEPALNTPKSLFRPYGVSKGEDEFAWTLQCSPLPVQLAEGTGYTRGTPELLWATATVPSHIAQSPLKQIPNFIPPRY